MATKADKPQDIICFYNMIYIPAMKEHLMRIVNMPTSAEGAGSSDGAPDSPSLAKLTRNGASPQRVSSQRDVYVSQPRTPGSMTPRTKTLYSFGDTPAKLHNINLQLNRTPGSDAAAMHALQQMRASSTTPQQMAGPSEEEAGENSRKRSLNLQEGDGGRRLMQRRFEQLDRGGTDRSSSQASGGSEDMGDDQSS